MCKEEKNYEVIKKDLKLFIEKYVDIDDDSIINKIIISFKRIEKGTAIADYQVFINSDDEYLDVILNNSKLRIVPRILPTLHIFSEGTKFHILMNINVDILLEQSEYPYIDHVLNKIVNSEFCDISASLNDYGSICFDFKYKDPLFDNVDNIHIINITKEYKDIEYTKYTKDSIFCSKLIDHCIPVTSSINTNDEFNNVYGTLLGVGNLNNGTGLGIVYVKDDNNHLDINDAEVEAVPVFKYDPIKEKAFLIRFDLVQKISEEEEE